MTKPTAQRLPAWQRCDVSGIEARAFHAMNTGTANEGQQKTFMSWLANKASPALGLAFDPTSERASAFEAGPTAGIGGAEL